MQIVENWSRVRGRVVRWALAPGQDRGVVRLHVIEVRPVRRPDGSCFANLLDDACGADVDVQLPARTASALHVVVGVEIVLDIRRGRTGLFAHPDGVSNPGP
jgi:hypothetical protein